MSITLNGSGLASGITSVPNLATFPAGPGLAAINMPTGSVIQVVQATFSTLQSTTSSTYVTTSTTASITPLFSSSKILILISGGYSTSSTNSGDFTIYKNGSNLLGSGGFLRAQNNSSGVSGIASTAYLDSPATTSSITYACYYQTSSGTLYWNGNSSTSTITLLEIR